MEIIYGIVGFIMGGIVVFLLQKLIYLKKTIKISVYEELKQKYETNQQTIYRLDIENVNLRKNFDDYKYRAENSEGLLHKSEAELSAFKERNIHLTGEINKLEYGSGEDQNLIKELAQEVSVLKEEKAQLSAQIEALRQNYTQLQTTFSETKENLEKTKADFSSAKEYISELNEKKKSLTEKLDTERKDLLNIKEQFRNEFKLLADRVLEEKSKKFTEQNKYNIEGILSPLSKEIAEFKKKVEETYTNETRERHSLEKAIKQLVEQNIRISEEAHNLTKALKGSTKQQGDWGEMILESILEQSGLQKDREYFVQETLKTQSGTTIKTESGKRMQPDIRIKYPDGKGNIIIDAKVSLIAYERYSSIENDDLKKKQALNEHLISMKKHIDSLAEKKYHDFIEGSDFTMMFVPVEPAYITAVQADIALWKYAYDKRIILISPTNLIAVLKLVKDMWERKYQNDYALEIADRGGKLYDKFVNFIESLEEVGKYLEKSKISHDKALKQLTHGKGNLIRQAEQLKALRVKTEKHLPEHLINDAD